MGLAQLEIRLLRNTGDDDIIKISPVVDAFKLSYIDGMTKSHHFFYANQKHQPTYTGWLREWIEKPVTETERKRAHTRTPEKPVKTKAKLFP
jgi:hypothetical protein